MGYLDEIPEKKLYTPPHARKYKAEENAAAWNNNRPEVTEDFSDSPFADRKDGNSLE